MLVVFFSPLSAAFGANGDGVDPAEAKGFDCGGALAVAEAEAEAKGFLVVVDC